MESHIQAENQLPEHMRSHHDPRAFAEDLNPGLIPSLAGPDFSAAWNALELAMYWPTNKEQYFAFSKDLFEKAASAHEMTTEPHTKFEAQLTLATFPVFEKRLHGFKAINQEDIEKSCEDTAPILRAIAERMSIEEDPVELANLRGVMGEGLSYWFLAYANDERRIPFFASNREDKSRGRLGNHDVYVVADDAVKVPIQVKFSHDHARKVKNIDGVGVVAIEPLVQQATNTINTITALDNITDIMCRAMQDDPTLKDEDYAALDFITDTLLEKVEETLTQVIDQNGAPKIRKNRVANKELLTEAHLENAIYDLGKFIANLTQSSDVRVARTSPLPFKNEFGQSTRFDTVEVSNSYELDNKQLEMSEDVATRYSVDDSLELISSPTRRLQLRLDGEVVCNYTISPNSDVQSGDDPVSVAHLAFTAGRMKALKPNFRWRNVADNAENQL